MLEPSSNNIGLTGIEKQYQQVAIFLCCSLWKNKQHTISDNYILELALYTMNGEVN